jgi:hypothetical protein
MDDAAAALATPPTTAAPTTTTAPPSAGGGATQLSDDLRKSELRDNVAGKGDGAPSSKGGGAPTGGGANPGGDKGAGAPAPSKSVTVEETKLTPNFVAFQKAMAEINAGDAAEQAWETVVSQLIAAESALDAVSTMGVGSDGTPKMVLDLASSGFKTLMEDYQLPTALVQSFDDEVKGIKGKRVALWSGAAAKAAAAKSGKADVFLEGTALGKPFDQSNLPKNVPSSSLHWASISRAYAMRLAAHVTEVDFVGFVDDKTRETGNIAAEVELPIISEALKTVKDKNITWYAAAAEGSKEWAEGKDIYLQNGTMLAKGGFWLVQGSDSNTDRGAAIKTAKASFKALEKDRDPSQAAPATMSAPATPGATSSTRSAS